MPKENWTATSSLIEWSTGYAFYVHTINLKITILFKLKWISRCPDYEYFCILKNVNKIYYFRYLNFTIFCISKYHFSS